MVRIPVALLLLLTSCILSAAGIDPASVRRSLELQLSLHPESTLRDVYKSFFQDNYGPGHLLSDTAVAKAYLVSEAFQSTEFDGILFEPTGADGNYVRVNLSLIRDSIIPFDRFFDAFLLSCASVSLPRSETWKELWRSVDSVISEMNLAFEDEKTDRELIDSLFQSTSEQMALHHSRQFNEAYHPHYRIISTPIFIHYILPYLRSSSFIRNCRRTDDAVSCH